LLLVPFVPAIAMLFLVLGLLYVNRRLLDGNRKLLDGCAELCATAKKVCEATTTLAKERPIAEIHIVIEDGVGGRPVFETRIRPGSQN